MKLNSVFVNFIHSSMSQWGGQPQPGQVTFFDPSKFQSNAQQPFPNPQQQQTSNQPGASENSWSSWGAWDPAANPYASNFGENTVAVSKEQTVNNGFQNAADHQQTQQQVGENQQPWFGEDHWREQQALNSVTLQNQWDVNAQNQAHWDTNNQQWVQNQYNYGEYAGYSNYWDGQNATHASNQNGYENTDGSAQVTSSGNYYAQYPNIQYTASQSPDTNLVPSGHLSESGTGQHSDLNVTQSTESGSQSADHSIGNIEDGGGMTGFYNNDDYEEDEESDDDDDDDEESESNIESNVIVNSSSVHGASHFENESENRTEPVMSTDHIQFQQNSDKLSGANELTNQMQAMKIQDNSACQSGSDYRGYHGYSNVPTYLQQSQVDSNVPMTSTNLQDAAGAVMGKNEDGSQFMPSDQTNSVPWPPPEQSPVEENTEENTGSQTNVTATPTFSDWEFVPQNGTQVLHSRNASADNNNVQFFIGSNTSSARVSPATSAKGSEDKVEQSSETEVKKSFIEKLMNDENAIVRPAQVEVHTFSSTVERVGIPPASSLQPVADISTMRPPQLRPPRQTRAGEAQGGNPFRKSPNTAPATSVGDSSMLSSTQLDITQRGYENSPVTLGPEISPIIPESDIQNRAQQVGKHTEDNLPGGADEITDTPVLKQTRKAGGNVKQSPIMPRKESAFQPPKQDQKPKPMKASHDIPGVEPQVQKAELDAARSGVLDRKGRQTPERETDRYSGRKNLERDAQSERQEDKQGKRDSYDSNRDRYNRRGEGYDRGRRTPDWDDRRNSGRQTPDRDSRYRGDRDRGYGERSSRQRQSAFHHIDTNRRRDNVSPAASLLDVAESVPAMANILLVPASASTSIETLNISQNPSVTAPSELKPVASLITSLSEQIKSDDSTGDPDPKSGERANENERDRGSRDRYRDREGDRTRYGERENRERGDLRGNRSYDSLKDRNLKDRNDSRDRLSLYSSRNSLDGDDPRDRSRRGDSRERDRRYRDDYYDRYR